jgi:predicted dehydrogenase
VIKIGVLGTGQIVQHAFLPGFSERGSDLSKSVYEMYSFGGCDNGKVVSICGRDVKKAKQIAERFKIQKFYTDWRKIIDDKEIDAVCVATPNYLHHEMAVAAAESDKHVLVEKPIACSLREADQMIQAAAKHNVILMMQQTFRFAPAVDVTYRIIHSGILGKPIKIRTNLFTPGPDMWAPGNTWFFDPQKAGHGALLDLGVHTVDLVRYLSGKNIRQVAAFGGTFKKPIELDDNAIGILMLDDDTLGMVEVSWTGKWEIAVDVLAENGRLQMKIGDERPVKVDFLPEKVDGVIETSSGEGEIAGIRGTFIGGVFFPCIPSETKYRGPFQYFVNCIINNENPFVSGHEGRKDLEVILACYRSIEQKSVVSLPIM